jgi:UDP-N-acetylmuramoylalanine--D-glutamate ligase
MIQQLKNFFTDASVLILGFGREGKSTLKLLNKLNCCRNIAIADDGKLELEDNIETMAVSIPAMKDYDIVMKSPGIPLLGEIPVAIKKKITSQTDLLLRFAGNTVIGITGTKGKSTVSSLVYHILKENNVPAVLIGNIGVPPLDTIYSDDITVVCEMSCHQLEYVSASPHIAVLLNIHEEHLDHYNSFSEYKFAKENIFRYQKPKDTLIYGESVSLDFSDVSDFSENKISSANGNISPAKQNLPQNKIRVNFPDNNTAIKTQLAGKHNLFNILVAAETVKALNIPEITEGKILRAVETFEGLPHRLEKFANINGADYVNDSISTIPQATLFALDAFPRADTLIIGGMERGISYAVLEEFLSVTERKLNVIALPDSGYRIIEELAENYPENKNITVYTAENLKQSVDIAKDITKSCCVFSPAAASYGFYKNFEERGEAFKRFVLLQ